MKALSRVVAAGLSFVLLPVTSAGAHPGTTLPVKARAAQSAGPLGPIGDLFALGQGFGQTPAVVPTATRPEPPQEAAPRAVCGPGSKPEPGIQGRIPAGAAATGLHCNVSELAHTGSSGGFKTWRYVDVKGRECAYYDTALLYPLNFAQLGLESQGVVVLDMTDPAKPVKTDQLTEVPMLTPHESVVLNERRGLIAAVSGNPGTYPGLVSVYDASQDCRHPVLKSTAAVARLGHEGGFSPDGNTYYAAGTAYQSVTAIDVSDPASIHPVWQGNVISHGLSLSPDGNRMYIAAATEGQFVVLDVSEIQARKPAPQAAEVARLTWQNASIPQNAYRFTRGGRPYILEFDEYANGFGGDADAVGAARIIDISNEREPRVVGQIRLQVHQRADHAAASGDPGAQSPVQGYANHYCSASGDVDPTVVACSMIASGLRVFDITDVTKPKEIAYHVAPTNARVENGFQASAYAMSRPSIVPERREVWYSDGTAGFYVLRVAEAVWPKESPALTCVSKRAVRVTLRIRKRDRVRSIRATVAGRVLRVTRAGGRYYVTVRMNGLPRRTVRMVAKIRLRNGRTITDTRTYHPCSHR